MENQVNTTTLKVTRAFGIMMAISGMFAHGLFEVLQGFQKAPGLIIQAIGPDHAFWVHGTEEAFTLIPNFLITGILTILVSAFILYWSLKKLNTKRGSSIFLGLFILLTLVGGGIAQVLFYTPVWAFSTRILKEPKSVSKWKPEFKSAMREIWPYTLSIAVFSFLVALLISIFGYVPGGLSDDTKLYLCWSMLGFTLLLTPVTYLSAYADDTSR